MDANKINLGGGVVMSIENDNAVPDTTVNAGPDTIKLHEDAQKPENDSGAEYDAAQHVDVPEDIEKANESTFFGIILKHRSEEAFAKTKGVFPNAEAFFKSNECKQAIAVAKQWAEKHKLTPAAVSDLPENLKKLGASTKSMSGLVLAYSVKNNKVYVDVLFKNAKGKVTGKKFAVIKTGEAKKAAGSESAPAAGAVPPVPAKPSVKKVLSKENDPVDNAFATTTDPPPAAPPAPPAAPVEPPATPAPAPAPTTTPAEPAIPEAPVEPPVETAPEITDDEIEVESQGTESFLAAISSVLKSREEADASVSEIKEDEVDEVVGDSEGDDIAEAGDAEPTEESEEEQSIEAFLAGFKD
jgi:hypothetical protein